MHKRIYEGLGLAPEDIIVQHFLAADVAQFKPALVPDLENIPS